VLYKIGANFSFWILGQAPRESPGGTKPVPCQLRSLGSVTSSSSGVWGRASAASEFLRVFAALRRLERQE